MKADIKKLEKSQLEITIEVSPEEVRPYLEKAAIKISQEAKIPGFRPGKAPYEMIKQKFGEMAIMQEAIDDIISKTYYQTLKENEIVSIGQPKIDIEKMAPENPFVYKATISTLPKITLGDYSSIKLSPKKVEVKDDEVNKVIEDIRTMRATSALTDRAAKTGDRLEINFDIFIDNVPIENGQHKKYPITLGEGRFIPGFEEQLAGLKTGDTKEFELKFPEEYFQKNLANKKALFKVTCNAVYEVTLPKVDDDFAKDISAQQFKTVQELKDSVKKNLEEEQKMKENQRLEVEMMDKIIAISKFEPLPEVLVHGEVHKMLHELEHNIEDQGFKFEDYLKNINKTEEELEKELMPQAEARVKSSILAREIYQEQKIEVREDEVEKEIEEMVKRYSGNPEARKQLESETYKDYIRNMIGNRKVMEYLKNIIIK